LADINVWLALAWAGHRHSAPAWTWFRSLSDGEVLFCRLTQLGLLRLLTTKAVMGEDCLTLGRAWAVYDRCLLDPKVGFRQEGADVEAIFRRASAPFRRTASPKAIGDCYLVAASAALKATLVTFDHGLADVADRLKYEALLLA
jgi:uncharacterized protein